MDRRLRVLVVEDTPDDAEMMLLVLRRGGIESTTQRVETADELRAALDGEEWDIVLSDYTLPGFNAEAGLRIVREADPDLPFIVVSGTVGEDTAVAMMRAGASDYVLKHQPARQVPAVNREVREAENRRAGREAERQARQLAAIVSHANHAVISQTLDWVIVTWNAGAERLYGYSAEETIGRNASFLIPPDRLDELRTAHDRVAAGGSVPSFDTIRLHKSGRRLDVSISLSPVRDSQGRVVGVSGMGTDITERIRSERERRLLLSIVEYSPDFIGIAGLDERVVFVNRGGRAMVGLDGDEEVARTSIPDYFDDAERERIAREVLPVLKQGGHVTGEAVFRHFRTGASIPTEWNVFAVPDATTGEPAFLACVAHDIGKRKQALEALRLRDRAIRAATQGLVITDPGRPDNPIVYASPGFERMTGYTEAEYVGRNCRFLQGKDTDPNTVEAIREAIRTAIPCTVELRNYRKDGTPFWNELSISPIQDAAGRTTHFVGVLADVTGRRTLEEQFRQAQKMEAVGQLAGGVAHDFNNLLTIINGYSDILLRDLPEGSPAKKMVAEIHKAGERSAGLTRQLLAFSRRQVLAPRLLDLNEVVAETEKMLRRLIGEDVQLTTVLAPGLWAVHADPGQIEQVLMNLAVNARDAMPSGGKLTIETANVELDESYLANHADARIGPHVLLGITDTGTGIAPELMERIFEPFFTTKGQGKGTGLGLATVHGIVKQSGGHVSVYSEVGVGTAFKVYLPMAEKSAGIVKGLSGIRSAPRGTETILLVEDEDAVRALTRHVLTGCGYQVIEAADCIEAVRAATGHAKPIHLLISDVVMPGGGGRHVAEKVTQLHPGIRVLFVSGYTDDAVVRHGVLREGVNFLQKPYAQLALAAKVRQVLDGTA